MKSCQEPGCTRPLYAKRQCQYHYLTARRKENPAAQRSYYHRYMRSEKGKLARARALQRRMERVELATPPWSDTAVIRRFYEATPPGHTVDHIIPLGGNDVCGLHVLANLQYLPPADNYRKGNRLNSSLTEGTPRGQSTKEE